MRLWFFVFALVLPYVVSAQTCTRIDPLGQLSWVKDANRVACENLRTQYKCAEREREKLAGLVGPEAVAEQAKFLTCDRSQQTKDGLLETQWLGSNGCLVNGLRLTVESIKDLGTGVVNMFKDAEACYQDVQKKREMVVLFNLSVSDRYTLEPRVVDEWTCGQIEQQLSARKRAQDEALMREHQRNVNAGRSSTLPVRTPEPENALRMKKLLDEARAQLETTYMCYTAKAKAEMVCAGVVSLVADVALSGGALLVGKAAVVGMRGMAHSSQAMERIRRAAARGQKIDLKDSSLLSDSDRLKTSQELLARRKPFTKEQKDAILEAHEVGLAEGRGFGSYTTADLAAKARILRKAGFDQEEVRKLMESGMTGKFGHDQRIAAEKLFGDVFVKGREKLPQALSEGRKFYGQFVTNGQKFFTKDETGFRRLLDANGLGLNADEAIVAFKHNLVRDPKQLGPELRAGYSSTQNYILELEKTATSSGVDYKIYRAKELRQKFIDEYLQTKYANKYGDVDLDRVDPRELRLQQEALADLEKARRAMQSLKLPVEVSKL